MMDNYIGFNINCKKTVTDVVQKGKINQVRIDVIFYPINVARHFSAYSDLPRASQESQRKIIVLLIVRSSIMIGRFILTFGILIVRLLESNNLAELTREEGVQFWL